MAKRIALLDGFEDYPGISTSGVGLLSNWSSIGSTGKTLIAGRVGGQAFRTSTAGAGIDSSTLWKNIDEATERSDFFAFRVGIWGHSGDGIFYRLANGANTHISLASNVNRDLVVYRGNDTANEIARVPAVIHENVWYSINVCWKSGTSDGTLQVYLNGELIVDMSATNTKHDSYATANRLYLRGPNLLGNTGSTTQGDFDDIRVDLDTTDPIPEGRYAVVEYATDDSVQFTPLSGSDNYLMIDDPTCDQDTTYNASNTVGHRDVFTVNALPFNPDRIMAIQLTLIARKEDVATRRVKSFLISDSVEVDSNDMYLSTDYTINRFIIQNDPATGVEFTKGGLAAVKPGYELVE